MSLTEQIQVRSSTSYDRYPATFQAAADLVRSATPAACVLSFGCSTGLECATLSELYFDRPDDRIVGVDTHTPALSRARRHNQGPRISYYDANDPAYLSASPFDAVFAMAVLCLHDEQAKKTGDAPARFPFSRFSELCEGLDAKVKTGGLLVIVNASYRFTDARVSKRYTPIADPTGRSGFVPKYKRDGERLRKSYPFTLFVKRA